MLQQSYVNRILEQALEMVIMFDMQGNIISVNNATKKLLGYDNFNIKISEIFPDIITYDHRGIAHVNIPENTIVSQSAYRQNRTCFNVKLRTVFIPDDLLTICLASDESAVTYYEHRMTEAVNAKESAEAMKTNFVSTVTHELRTPVNGIQGNLQSLYKNENNPEKLATLNLIERECKEMHSLINNILDYSKLTAGKMELDPKEFEVRDMMEYIKGNHYRKIVDKGLDFFMDVSADVPEKLVGDELRLGEIINNLISNATKFTPAGKISVEVIKTAQRGKDVELFFMVSDTGIGISEENKSKLFQSFSQVEASTYRKYGGTGLGLSISQKLVEMMGGKIRVDSEVNKGTMFSFNVWLSLPNDADVTEENQTMSQAEIMSFMMKNEDDGLYVYGTPENRKEFEKKMSKLILCVEMKNWEKAETFMEGLRQLSADAPQEIKSVMLRLKMAVQKSDYDKTIENYDKLKKIFEEE